MQEGIMCRMTPAQSRAARGLLGITQDQLAKEAEVSLRTLANYEKGATKPTRATLAAIQRAFEAAGVEFTDGGVRLKPLEQPRAYQHGQES